MNFSTSISFESECSCEIISHQPEIYFSHFSNANIRWISPAGPVL